MRTHALVGAAMAAMISGCSTTTVKVEDGNTVVMDATKRLVITSTATNEKDKPVRRVVCAEPSPDAAASKALEAALKANVPQANVSAEAATSYAKTVASIGLRTASIQILRDLGYRACEAVMNGVLDAATYKQIIGAVDDATLGLVAIEGLAQMQAAPLVAVSSSGTASTSSGPTATANPATITFHDIVKDYKPEELKNVADSIVQIIKVLSVDAVITRTRARVASDAAQNGDFDTARAFLRVEGDQIETKKVVATQ